MRAAKLLTVLALLAAPAYSRHATFWNDEDVGNTGDDDGIEIVPLELYNSEENTVDVKNYTVCQKADCKALAEEFLRSMNKSADPCDDFYEYTCGGWKGKDVIPPDAIVWSRFMMFHRGIRMRAKEVLESKPHPNDTTPFKRAKQWYRSCMDKESIERRGVKPIASILMQGGGWPVTMEDDEWADEDFSWKKVELYYTRLTGAPTFYRVTAEGFPGLPTIAPPPKLPIRFFKMSGYTGDVFDMYSSRVKEVAKLIIQDNESDVSKERLNLEVRKLVKFERKINELTELEADLRNMTIDKFLEWYDNDVAKECTDSETKIDFRAVMKVLLDMSGLRLDTSKTVCTWHLEYIKGLSDLLKVTPPRTIVNYIHWNFVANMFQYTSDHETERTFQAWKVFGVTERRPRWLKCIEEVKMVEAYAGHLLSEKYLPKSTLKSVRKMIKNLQKGLERQIDKSDWLDEQSKLWAWEKIESMKLFIGYPEWFDNATAITNMYKGLTLGNDYFDNTLSYMRFAEKQDFRTWAKFDFLDILAASDPLGVSPAYAQPFNSMIVRGASLQPPIFLPNIPSNVNYGIAGFVIGHELGHGFDNEGIEYGRSPNGTKLPEPVLDNYYQRADCFIDQYAKYFDRYYGVNPPESGGTTETPLEIVMSEFTEAENIADSTGLQTVFETWKKISRESPSGQARLPGLEQLTDDQLFFVSFANAWCQIARPRVPIERYERDDPHSPMKFRVIGAVSNTKGFAKTFKCPLGSRMNPSNKCNIWKTPGAATSRARRS